MKNVSKLFLALVVFFSVFGIYSSVSAAETQDKQISVKDYAKFLKEEAKNNNEAKENSKKFKTLSKDKQEKLVQYLNDPAVFQEFLEASNELAVGKTVSLKNGDVVIKKEMTTTVEKAPGGEIGTFATNYRKATYTVTQEVFGFPITKLSSYVSYTHNGSRVTSTYDNGAFVTNYNPGVGIKKDVRSHYHTSTRAYSTTIWEGAFAKWSPIVKSKEQQVWGNYSNKTGGYLINL